MEGKQIILQHKRGLGTKRIICRHCQSGTSWKILGSLLDDLVLRPHARRITRSLVQHEVIYPSLSTPPAPPHQRGVPAQVGAMPPGHGSELSGRGAWARPGSVPWTFLKTIGTPMGTHGQAEKKRETEVPGHTTGLGTRHWI